MRKQLTPEEANAVFDLLIADCGARETMRFEFVHYHIQEPWPWPSEFRFQGKLGFGGKFWNEHNGWRVSCYRENETPEIRELITVTNMKLATMYQRRTT